MEEIVALLREWQELAAAIISAASAFAVAFLVSHLDRRREDVSAGMVLVGNLTTVMGANETLRILAEKEKVSADDYPMWLTQRLSSSTPTLSPLFDGCVAKLFPIDTNLAAHLELFQMIYRSVERHLQRLNEDIAYFREHKALLRSKDDVKADAEVVRSGFALAAKHAQCGERLISLLVLSRWPTVHRLKRLVWKHELDSECKKLLETGAL